MAKMKDVCERTGLTEKTVRLYVKKGLITPQTEEGIHRTSYHFSEEDIRRLKDIAVLRRAGFSISEIDQLQKHPEHLPAMIEEKKTILETELLEKQALQRALGRLSVTDQGSVTAFSQSLAPVTHYMEQQETPPKKHPRIFYVFITFVVFSALLAALAVKGAHLALAAATFAALILAVVSFFLAGRYLAVSIRVKSLPVWAKGSVISVIQEPGIDSAYARAGMSAPGFSEPGRGGLWLIPVLLWGELRPDNWYPLIHCQTDGGTGSPAQSRTGSDTEMPTVSRTGAGREMPTVSRAGTGGAKTADGGTERSDAPPQALTFAYGAFRNTWREGVEIALTRDPRRPERFLPAESGWLLKKALLYVILGLAASAATWYLAVCFSVWFL